jgi:hypothetical protein
MHGSDAAVGEPTIALGNVMMDVAGCEHWFGATGELGLVQAPGNPALAVGKFAVYSRVHSKSLLASGFGEFYYLSNPGKAERFRVFMKFCRRQVAGSLP